MERLGTRLAQHASNYITQKLFEQNGRLLNVETGSHELAILSYATVCLHPSVSLNNDNIYRHRARTDDFGKRFLGRSQPL